MLFAGAGCNRAAKSVAPSGGQPSDPAAALEHARPPGPLLRPEEVVQAPKGPPPEEIKFVMTAAMSGFFPAELRVKQGKLVRISITTKDTSHTFILDGYGIRQAIEPKMTADVSFIADKKGTFGFHCNSHPGMQGMVIVE